MWWRPRSKALAGTRHVILCGLRKPVTFFAYPNKPTSPVPAGRRHPRARPPGPGRRGGARPAGRRTGPLRRVAVPDPGPRPEPQRGKLTPELVAATLAALLPEQAVITDEAVTFGRGFFPFTYGGRTA